MALKYCFNTWSYSSFPVWVPSYSLEEAAKRIARAGYHGIEIGCAAPHAWPAYLSAARRAELRRMLNG
jgi:protein FrlC